MNREAILLEERKRIENLKYGDEGELDSIKKKLHMLASNIFGIASKYVVDIRRTNFHVMAVPVPKELEIKRWESGKRELINIIDTMLDEIRLFSGEEEGNIEIAHSPVKQSNERKIFIVHGHDEAMKQTVARVVEKIDFEAVILHEKENKGRAIIEKFTDYSDVGFAIVLLSSDDVGGVMADPLALKARARQNVIFEMGYFIGKLGRDRVVVLHPSVDEFEMPSDYSGVIYIDYDNKGSWKFDLAKELKASGYDVDLNKLL
jgi:predicted nucleotide-binding protein